MADAKAVSEPDRGPALTERKPVPRARGGARSGWRTLGLTLLSLALGLTAWHLMSALIFGRHLLPPPLEVATTAVPMIRSGEIFVHIGISLMRITVGFVLGSALAVVVGVLMGRLRVVYELFDPIIEVLRYLSPTAMIPIAVIWFGIGETSKYFLIFWGTFFFVLINTIAGVARTPIARQRAAQCLGASRVQIFLLVVLPSALPYVVTGMRVAMASSFMSIVPAEMLAADSGIGFLLQQSGLLMQTNRIFVALVVISLLGFLTDRAFRWAVNKTLSRYMGQPTVG